VTLKSLEPILWVRSIEDSVAFYQEKLGFELQFAMTGDGGKMLHASVVNGDVALMLGDAADRSRGGGAELYTYAENVDEYYARVRAAGAQFTQEITDQYWGDRTFTVTDPDGYVLTFAQTVRGFDPARDVPAVATV